MNIPGFTAEFSLRKATECYAPRLLSAGEGSGIEPQRIVRSGNTIIIYWPGDPFPVEIIHIPTLY
jgi:hypothetical protein